MMGILPVTGLHVESGQGRRGMAGVPRGRKPK
jgi:hypothetical protein